jgi:hypothetical protein
MLNKILPGLKIQYKQSELINLNYHSGKETSMLDLVEKISTSFQHLDEAYIYLTENIKYAVSEIYDDWIASEVTLPCQVFNIP